LGDCLLAAGGNPVVAAYSHDSVLRPNVVGFFERRSSLTADQATWANELDKLVGSAVHPREYIHGAASRFREPKDAAALVYEQTAAIVGNSALVTPAIARELGSIPTLISIRCRPDGYSSGTITASQHERSHSNVLRRGGRRKRKPNRFCESF